MIMILHKGKDNKNAPVVSHIGSKSIKSAIAVCTHSPNIMITTTKTTRKDLMSSTIRTNDKIKVAICMLTALRNDNTLSHSNPRTNALRLGLELINMETA